jgi:starch phosphorylase
MSDIMAVAGGEPRSSPMPPEASTLDRFVARTRIAYFSMEIAIWPQMPTYSGGLGILAGDTARTAADLGLPMVFVTLVSRAGYLRQILDAAGQQEDVPEPWDPQRWATPLHAMAAVEIERRVVWIRPWLHVLERPTGGAIPILLLDTDVSENTPADRTITGRLYGGDTAQRLKQEIVLGIGGERLLRALGFEISTYHLNEGHAALLTLSLLRRHPQTLTPGEGPYDVSPVRESCVFTTHTPVEAGQDRFTYDLVERLLGAFIDPGILRELGGEDALNMTRLALNLSSYVNGVAERHQETAKRMFPGYPIRAITNGVHPATWAHPAFARLFDKLVAHWPHEPELLGRADLLPDADVRAAHAEAKIELLAAIRDAGGPILDPELPVLAFARRMTGYKRPHLLLDDPDRLVAIAQHYPFQVVFAGKAHPQDSGGKDLIARLHSDMHRLKGKVALAFLHGYDFALARKLVSGADIWLNTPQPPLEASGTSGMKAALNGVPSLSVLDGWWLEGCIEGVTGWAIGVEGDAPESHGAALMNKLEGTVLPLFHDNPAGWSQVMKGAISKVGAVFTSHRMMRRYAAEAYLGRGG